MNGLRVSLDLAVPMRDGAVLSADLYRPPAGERFPVLLCRTPYDNQAPRYVEWAGHFARAGYAVVIQDCRGRYDSGGEWTPYLCEEPDGVDTVDWIARQPWCDGGVGMFGSSYVGFTQLLAALGSDGALNALVPTVNQEDNFGHIWCDGVLQLQNAVNFARIGRRTMHTAGFEHLDLEEVYRRLPVVEALDGIADCEPYRTFLAHPTFDDYWRSYSLKGRYGEIGAPAYLVGGWFDNLVHEAFKCFQGLRTSGGTAAARDRTRLIVGPWAHATIGLRETAGVDYGPDAEVDVIALQLRWYDQRLRGIDSGLDGEAPLQLFVMGENRWRGEWEWPLARTEWTPYHLRAGGELSAELPREEEPDAFTYDPDDPVPTRGGQSMFLDNTGPRDRREVEERPDVLVYTGPVLEEPLEATGPVTLVLHAASSAVDTDFTATLVDVDPSGVARAVSEGIVRARYRDSLETPRPIVPGEVVEYRIALWETSHRFGAGHRIRLEVSSSNFPRFDRNLNTGGPIGFEDRFEVAHQLVHHDAARPSRLVLPVIP